ncbi:MAG: hypothetical protein EOP60_14790 [Sphingomonadales bacterium]|nr:MAG: hypothetical protein EOP60_14790 [Sphingomonadales bacterium]
MRSLWFVALTVIATPALAQQSAEAPKPEKKICRPVATTGSILGGKRECRTKAEWAALAERDRDQRDAMDRDMRSRHDGAARTN